MALQLKTVPCLVGSSDNYVYLVHDDVSGETALIDASEAAPVLAALTQEGWNLTQIWLTHHHDDHIQGLDAIKAAYKDVTVTGSAADQNRLPPLDRAVSAGDFIEFAGHAVQVWDVSGHTIGHIAYIARDLPAAFTGDSLMVMGCGRLFEGDAATMLKSLEQFASLPDETLICSGHEITQGNIRFALTVEPDNADLRARLVQVDALRAQGQGSVPAPLGVERATNPFLRTHLAEMKAHLNMTGAPDHEVFATLRSRKDNF